MRLNQKRTDFRQNWQKRKKALLKSKTVQLLLAALLLGVLMGVFSCRLPLQASVAVRRAVDSFVARRTAQGFWEGFANALKAVLWFSGLLTVCGMAVGGTVLVPTVLLLRGIGLGAAGYVLCTTHGTSGALYGILVLLPFVLTGTGTLLIMAQAGMQFSGLLFAYLREEQTVPLLKPFARYGIQTGIGWLLLFPAALLDSAWNLLLNGVFHLN